MKKIIKFIMIILTFFYPLCMTSLAGAGLIYNKSSYGEKIALIGFFLIFSGLLITAGVFLCFSSKKTTNKIAAGCSVIGTIICLSMLYLLCSHADNAGWCDNYTLLPVSSMYKRRIFPVVIPSVLSTITAIFNIKQNRTS